MSIRTDKIASVIQHAVQEVIMRGLGDPRIRGLVSITRVEVAPDLSEAKVHISVLPEQHEQLTMHGLHDAAGHIQHEISKAVVARRLPRLKFVRDDSLKKQAQLEAALRGVRDSGDGAAENMLAKSKGEGTARNESEDLPR